MNSSWLPVEGSLDLRGHLPDQPIDWQAIEWKNFQDFPDRRDYWQLAPSGNENIWVSA